ncbi:MAG: gliding motility-associated C-terminal domain-containing protein [Phaeodactylibacter sp.]|nr:gliding motility-associated C-terminal domain-containing protein [Phaeodactylibacter sp.]
MKRRLLYSTQFWSFAWLLTLVLGAQSLRAKENIPLSTDMDGRYNFNPLAAPMFVDPPGDTTVIGICNVPAPEDLLVTDDLDADMMVSPLDSTDTGGIGGTVATCALDTLYRIWRHTDSEMITITHIQRIIVQPMPEPDVSFVGTLDTIVDCKFAIGAYNSWRTSVQLKVGSNINECASVNFAFPPFPFFPEPCDTLRVNISVFNDCSDINADTAYYEARFITIDTTPPVLNDVPPSPVIVGCDTLDQYLLNNPPSMVSVIDCQSGLTAAYEQDTLNVTCSDGREFDLHRKWMAWDSCGNYSEAVHIVMVRDQRAPFFTTPPDITISCEQDYEDLSLTGMVNDTLDNCGGPILLGYIDQLVPDNDNCPQSFRVERNWRARDVCNNTSQKKQIITIQDVTPPTFVVPADTTVDCGKEGDLMVTGVPTMLQDNCTDADSLSAEIFSETILSGMCEGDFVIERAWRVEDACRNVTELIQRITVIDTIAPEVTTAATGRVITCMEGMDLQTEFAEWINSQGGAQASDLCTVTDSLKWTAYKAGTAIQVSMPDIICPASSDTIIMQMVDFVVQDACGHADTTTASFIVIDNTAPVISGCPEDVAVSTDPALCQASFVLKPPLVEEECAAALRMDNINLSTFLTSNAQPGQAGTTPVNPIELNFTVASSLPINAAADASLELQILSADAEGPTEYLRIIGEDGVVIGRTGRSAAQCAVSDTTLSIPMDKINAWALDGVITIRLEPNIPATLSGSYAVNDICPGGSNLTGNLSFLTRDFAQLEYQYRINDGTAVTAPFFGDLDVVLPIGENTITYLIRDCAGNMDSCTYKVMVEDQEPPILACPDDVTVDLEPGSCSTMITLPFPEGVTDNCGVAGIFERTAPVDTATAWLSFTYDPNLNDYLADTVEFLFQDVAANAVSGVTLTLDLRGDFSGTGAFLNIFGDSGNQIGTTSVGVATCDMPGQVTFSIPADTFNVWAADGMVQFMVQPNPVMVPPGVPGDGINPCDPAVVDADGEVDSISYIFATLTYGEISPFYFAEGATDIAFTQVVPPVINPTHEFNVGETVVSYVIADDQGNQDTCSYSVFVVDNEPPVALCQATIVEINPSGLEVDTVSVQEFNAGSRDNCMIDTMYVSPNTFTCEQAGTTVMATLTVVDLGGNTSTCTQPIRIEAEGPSPTYSPGICGGDTLYLFANPPVAQGGVVYTYRWYHPNGSLVSTQQNPIIPDVDGGDAGAYVLEITGLTGCMAEEVVNVTITNQPLTPAINTDLNVCNDEDIILTSSITLNNATYQWYQGLPGDGQPPIASTNTPQYIVSGPHQPGTRQYYLVIKANGCLSEPSAAVSISVVNRPVASANDDDITICEGEPVVLGTFVTGVTYQWTGPAGFSSSSQLPTVIDQATLANAGVYQLVVTKNGCSSEPDFTVVNVLPKPARPALTVDTGPVCAGEDVVLKALPAGASTYHWIGPSLQEFITNSNIFVIPGATALDAGVWRVYTKRFGCSSDDSNPVTVIVNNVPDVLASASPSAVCERSRLELFATPSIPGANYLWTGPNNYMSVAQNPVINNVAMQGQGTYKLTVTTPAGCTDTTSLLVTVLPSVRIDALTNNAPSCLDGPTDILLKASVFPPDNGLYAYEWTGPGQFASADSCAVIPNATAANNGNYALIVTNEAGCRSMPASTVVNTRNAPQAPVAPTLDPSTQPPFCSGESITLHTNDYTGSNISYNWLTPGGSIPISSEILTLDNISPDDTGPYRVYVTVNGCDSDTSNALALSVNPIPVAAAGSNAPVCEGEPLQLVASPPGASYQWLGPITSSLQNPLINSADPILHSGVYSLVVTKNGCSSAPAVINVEVNEVPATPLASNSGPACIDYPGTALALSVSAGTATPGAFYTWYYNGDAIGSTQSLNFQISDFTPYGSGTHSFTVEASMNNCISDPSPPTVAELDIIPIEQANAGQDSSFCIGDAIQLNAQTPSISTGEWQPILGSPPGIEIQMPDNPETTVDGLNGGNNYVFVWALSNGACRDYSTDTVRIAVGQPEDAVIGQDRLLCAGDDVLLEAIAPPNGQGEWIQSQIQSEFNVFIDDSLDPNTTVSGPGVRPGNTYVFTWVVNSECGSDSADVFITISDNKPDAGSDQIACNDFGDATLDAGEPAEGSTGRWSSPDPAVLFANRNNRMTTVSNLAIGDNMVIWTLDDGFCGLSSRDTAIINYQENPIAVNDQLSVEFAVETVLNVLANDDTPPNSFISIIEGPARGTARVVSDSEISYLSDADFVGRDQLTYEVCSEGCECARAVVEFFVGEDVKCEAPSIITPNGDGINDSFIIPCLLNEPDFPKSQVQIYNRWGDEVYRSRMPYRNDWDGTFNGEELPADTYFYIVNFGDGRPPLNGYLMIQR